jgi:transporter family protein
LRWAGHHAALELALKLLLGTWQIWALFAAALAALTAILAKVGVEDVHPDFATFVRTIVVLLALGAILSITRQWQAVGAVSGRSYLFLALSGLATGASWVCYFRALKLGDAARVAPIRSLPSSCCTLPRTARSRPSAFG